MNTDEQALIFNSAESNVETQDLASLLASACFIDK
jgi:hypothetical protein